VGEEASFVACTLAVVLRGAAGRAPPGRARGRGRGRGQARLPHLQAGGAGARRARAAYPVDGLLPGRSGLPDGGVRGGRWQRAGGVLPPRPWSPSRPCCGSNTASGWTATKAGCASSGRSWPGSRGSGL